MFFIKLKHLYDSAVLIFEKFGAALKADIDATFTDIGRAIATKSWSDLSKTVDDAQTLLSDFLATWTGSQQEVQAFLQALRDLFTK